MTKEKSFTVRVRLIFSNDDLHKALVWGRRRKFTYERDGEIGALLLSAYKNGVCEGDIDDCYSDHPRESL